MDTLSDNELATFESVVLLYLACAKLTDGDLAPEEAQAIVDRARARVPELTPAYADAVVSSVAGQFVALSEDETRLRRVVLAAERLAEGLQRSQLEAVVSDLVDIAAADGDTSSAEQDFVLAVAKTFGIELEVEAGA